MTDEVSEAEAGTIREGERLSCAKAVSFREVVFDRRGAGEVLVGYLNQCVEDIKREAVRADVALGEPTIVVRVECRTFTPPELVADDADLTITIEER